MTHVDLPGLIRDLHYIHSSIRNQDLATFDHILSKAYTQLCELAQPPGAPNSLFLMNSVFPETAIATFTQLSDATLHNQESALSRIIDFVENGAGQKLAFDFPSHLKEVASQLSASRTTAVNGLGNSFSSTTFVESALSEFLLSTAESFVAAESHLTAYISQCLLHEIQHLSQGQLGEENMDTEKLVMADYRIGDHTKMDKTLDFECSDSFLTKTFYVFVGLAMKGDIPSTYDEIYPYANVLVAFYKSASQVSAVQFSEDSWDGSEKVLNFICGSSAKPAIVPAPMRDHAISLLTNPDFPNSFTNEISDYGNTGLPAQTQVSRNYTKTEYASLVADFETVVATLAEFGSSSNSAVGPTFRKYIFLVCEAFPDSATTSDFAFIDTVARTVSQVAHYAAEDDSSQLLLDQVLSYMQEISTAMSTVSHESTLLIRLAVSETQNSISYMKSCLRKWNSRALEVSQLSLVYEEDWVARREKVTLQNFFGKWQSKSVVFGQLKREAAAYCERKQISQYFNRRWIQKMLKNLENEGKSESFQRGKMLRVWMENAERKWDMWQASDTLYAANCMKNCFRRWTQKRENVKALKFQANFAGTQLKAGSDLLLKSKIWEHWQSKLDVPVLHDAPLPLRLSEKLAQLDKLGRQFLVQKYLGVLFSRSGNLKNLGLMQVSRKRNLKRHCFETWCTKKEVSHICDQVTKLRELSLKKSAFGCWFDQMHSRTSADLASRQKILKKAVLLWKLKMAESRFSQVQSGIAKRTAFKQWMLRYRGASIVKDTDKQLSSHMLSKWVKMAQKVSVNTELAMDTGRRFATSGAWAAWRSRMATNTEMSLVSDLNIQRKYLNVIGTKHAKMQQSWDLAESLLSKKSLSFSQRVQAQAVFRRWQETYLFRYESEASHALSYFQEEIRNKGMLSLMFRLWKSKFYDIRARQQSLEKNLVFFHNTNSLKSESLMVWIDATRANAQAMEHSIEFHKALLYKKFLLAWYEKYVSKARYLTEIADEVTSKKEYNHMLELLRKWNLAYTKNVRRNQQTCEMFVEKWQRIHLKSLFELWSYKANRKAVGEQYNDANTTFNTSPLSRKFLGSGGSLEYLDGASYLYTPVKNQVSRPALTPYKSGGSPTRLQETNQKMKTSRMDAMTNRYKLARGESGTRNGRNKIFSSFSLPPPARNSDIQGLASVIRPPPPPRFDDYSDILSAPDATSSPGEPRDQSNTDADDLVLETAKRLQKIKPVVIPGSKSDRTEFRVSPIKKLRERLQSRAEALKSPSEVFDS